MRNRVPASQSLHDRVIQTIKASQTKHDTYTNPSQEHNVSVGIGREVIYPDLVLTKLRTMTIEHLIEVETAESVTDAESSQWALYAQGPGTFWLIVPARQLAAAQTICLRKGVRARFGKWSTDNGRIHFEWLQSVAVAR
jgi:hypothetical protein